MLSATQWPAFNATLNGISGVLIVAGFCCIKQKQVAAHRACMLSACAVTTLFFISYILYHSQSKLIHFHGTGWIRPVYFSILLTHTVLAVTIVPLIIRMVWLAVHDRIAEHKRLSRWTFPMWLYVSVTGIVVYWMVYRA